MDLKILLAFIPLIGWAFGDFFIQKCSKKVGSVETLLFVSLLPLLITPFVWSDFLDLSSSQVIGLTGMSFLVFIYALILFHAFRVSKLSVVESIIALELPITVGFAVFIGKEVLSVTYMIFFLVICFGVFLASTKNFSNLKIHKSIFEKGVLLAILATALSSMANYYIGISSIETSPLIVIWYMHVVIAILCSVYLIATKQVIRTYKNFLENKKYILLAGFFDNIGWFGYMLAVQVMPISLTITISEAYIVLAAFLGYYFNKERLGWHQKVGAIIALASVVILTYIYS